MMNDKDLFYMKEALRLAKEAEAFGDVPVGALVVRDSDGVILGSGKNDKEKNKNPIGHAEINAIHAACEAIGGYYLRGCTLYVTLEPCPMCAGAILQSRVDRVVFALKDQKAGALGSVLNMNSYPLNHKVTVVNGICEGEAQALLREFFDQRRNKKKEGKTDE